MIYTAVGRTDNESAPFLTLFLRILSVMESVNKEKNTLYSPACVHVQELRDLIAIKNAMFADEQSDIQEFFLFLLSEFTKEFATLIPTDVLQMEDPGEEWEEVGTKGRRLVLNEASMDKGIVNSLFELQLRKQVCSFFFMNIEY